MDDTDIFDGCARLRPESCLETVVVGGPDADDFLQRLISCDLERVQSESGSRGTLLNGKGRILAYFDVHRIEKGLLLVIDEEMSAVLIEQLERLFILEDVELVRGSFGVISIQGPAAASKAEQLTDVVPGSFLASASFRGGRIVNRPRCPSCGFDLVVPLEKVEEIERELEDLAVPLATSVSSGRARIEAGFPRIGHEVTARSLPPEVGLDDAISYDKGCFVGQEVLARIRTYGHVNRQLRRISMADPDRSELAPIVVGDDLLSAEDAKAVAKVTSKTTGDGVVHLLVSVRRSHAEEGTTLNWEGQMGQDTGRYRGELRLPFIP
ncbi:MAG: hypothetical protein AAEJ65_05770 [Planctomycetota bacterium]